MTGYPFRKIYGGASVFFLAVIFSTFFPLGTIWGTMVLPLDLPEMTRSAGKIFIGHCQEASLDLDENGMPATTVRFHVLKGLKGVGNGEDLLIKQYGVQREPLKVREGERAIVPMKSMTISGKGYEVGEDYLLFLYPESSLGFTSPVGGGQGKFQVFMEEEQGDAQARIVLNPLGNRFLNGFSLPPEGGAIELNRMVERVERLMKYEK